ncbi:MAG: tetratricopeptide repeat protein [Methanobacteriota archaeon]|nr:MAG: tetratricopeptide repeat protein [Euryarchaeota archaeon]
MARLVVSQNERLMLHLLDMDKHRDMAQVPLGASQEGIARALGTQVHNASRALSTLEAEGLVSDRLAHVRGAPRRRRAYFLTDKGHQVARSTRERLETSDVEYGDGEVSKQVTLGEALRRIAVTSRHAPSLLEIVDLARRDEVISPERLAPQRQPAPDEPSAYRDAHGRPKVEKFFGRGKEIKTLSEVLSRDGVCAIHVYGMPGIGKSTLMSRVFDGLPRERPLFWYTFRDWDTDRSFVETFARFLSRLGVRKLSRAVASGVATADLYSPLTEDLKGLDAVIFLDDVHKVVERMELLLSMLIDATRLSRGSKVVFVSRVMLPFVPKDVRQGFSLEVTGLDERSAQDLMSSLGVEDASVALESGHGHPLLLSLIAGKGTAGGRRDVVDFVDSEVYTSLSDEERSALEILCVFRHAVAVEALSGIDYEVVLQLRRKALTTEQEDGIWLHDLLRDYFRSRLTSERKRQVHESAGAYCSSRQGSEWKLEALYHFVEAESWDDALRVTVENGEELGGDFPAEVLGLIAQIPEDAGESLYTAQLAFMRAQLNEGEGMYDEALGDYERAASLASEEDEVRAVILESVARLQADVSKWAKSLEAHNAALAIHEKSGDVEGKVREWLNIGVLHKRRGDGAKARESYSTALSIATKAENRAAQAACLNNMAILDWEEGLPGDAERKFRESIRMAHSVKDFAGEAKALENFARFCGSFQRLDESASLLLEASGAYLRMNEISEAKRMRLLAAEAMADNGKAKEAVESLREVLSDPSLKKRRGLFRSSPSIDAVDAEVRLALVSLLRTSGDFVQARSELDAYMALVRPLADEALLARGTMERAMILEESGDLGAAAAVLEEVERALTRTGTMDGLIAVNIRRGVVHEKLGDMDMAAEYYGRAEVLAKREGDDQARTIAIENLTSVNNRT